MNDAEASWVCPLCGRVDGDLEAIHRHVLREFRDRVNAGEDAATLFLQHALKRRPRQRQPGEGSVFRYHDADGMIRYGIKFTPESGKTVLRRLAPNGEIWTTEDAAENALERALVRSAEWIGPDGEYLSYGLDVRARIRDQEAATAYERGGLKGAREAREMSLKELARRSGTDPAQLRRMERGESQPSIATLRRLAEALGLHRLLAQLEPLAIKERKQVAV